MGNIHKLSSYHFKIADINLMITSNDQFLEKYLSNDSLPLSRSLRKFSDHLNQIDVQFSFFNVGDHKKCNSRAESYQKYNIPENFWRWQRKNKCQILGCQEVKSRLKGFLNRQDDIFIEAGERTLTIFDFKKEELTFFYSNQISEKIQKAQMHGVLLAPFLPRHSAILTHASAIQCQRKAAVFLASDNGGKTTVINKGSSSNILSDDQIIIRTVNNHLLAFPTPWGLYCNNVSGIEIGAFFLLEKSDRFDLSPIKPISLLEYLWNENLANMIAAPKSIRAIAFHLVEQICRTIPGYLMKFSLEDIDWNQMERLLSR